MTITIPEDLGFSSTRLQRISTVMQDFIDQGKLAGTITTVARRGQVVHLETLGWMDREAQRPMEPDAIFRICSMTKPVTAAAMMTLYEEGHFTLNTPVYEFIPGFKNMKVFVRETATGLEVENLVRPVTVRHLLTHTAGFSYGGNPDDPVDRCYRPLKEDETSKDLVEMLLRVPLAFQPGTRFLYGLSTGLLGCLIEIISGRPLDVFLQERIFDPLGMPDTGFFVPAAKADRLTAVYGHPDDGTRLRLVEAPATSPHLKKPAFPNGGGGLLSTAGDYGKFLQMLLDGGRLDGERILSPTTVELFSINQAPKEALPFNIAGDEDLFHRGYGFSLATRVLMDVGESGQAGSVGEFGWDGALCTHCWVDPKKELYGLLMTQHDPFNYYPLAVKFKQLTYQAIVESSRNS
jgi:CubicO group peptidase (beta-lactamase class C family)